MLHPHDHLSTITTTNMPLVSIIIPVYNMEPWIAQTLQSVLEQTFTHFQCIIIDDYSTDQTTTIIQSFNDPRIHLIQQPNAGVSAARNTGIKHAKGTYITFLDGDDLWHPTFLHEMLTPLQNTPHANLSWCNTAMFIDTTYIKKPHAWGNIHKTGNLWWDNLQQMSFTVGAFVAKKDVIHAIGPFDTTLTVGEDRDFLLRLLAYIETNTSPQSPSIHIPKELKFYRIRKNSAVRQAHIALNTEWSFMTKHLEHPNLPTKIKKKGYSNLAFKLAVIAAFGTKNLRTALYWYLKALKLDPLNLNLYILPIKKYLISILPKKKLHIPTLHTQ